MARTLIVMHNILGSIFVDILHDVVLDYAGQCVKLLVLNQVSLNGRNLRPTQQPRPQEQGRKQGFLPKLEQI